jgi:Lrp/AsnC family leucine-responsive transcriptional regulator
LERTTPEVFDMFAAAVRKAPEVMECHMVAGGFDYLLKTRVESMQAYRRFLGDVLLSLPGVRETHTFAVMEEIKSTQEIPL